MKIFVKSGSANHVSSGQKIVHFIWQLVVYCIRPATLFVLYFKFMYNDLNQVG